MRCALYFGSFNPLHIGHAAIAMHVLNSPDTDEFRFILSPHNPLKDPDTLRDAQERWEKLERTVQRMNSPAGQDELAAIIAAYTGTARTPSLPPGKKFTASDVEFHLPEPLYTYNTLTYLQQKEPDTRFILIIGADNLAIIEKWHQWKKILSQFEVWVYPRTGYDTPSLYKKYGTHYLDAPLIDISSTQIRQDPEWKKWEF